MNLFQFYQTSLLPYLDKRLVFHDLNLVDKGDHYTADCPQCKKHEAFLYKNSEILACNRKNSCGFFVSLTAYMNEGKVPRGREFAQVVKKMCELAGIEFIKTPYNEDARVTLVQDDRQKLLKDFLSLIQECLFAPVAAQTREYLEQRGWPEELLSVYEFGYYISADYIKEELEQRGYLFDDIVASGIYRSDWGDRIVYPWRDASGVIINFWARERVDSGDGKKYLLMSAHMGGSKAVPFGWQWLSGSSIIIVEGFFDVLTLKAHAITNALAAARAGLSHDQIHVLLQRKPQAITFCYDNDEAGVNATEQDIDKLINSDIQLFVVPPHYLGGAKDPDEFCQLYGSFAFQELIAVRIHALRYKAQCLLSQHKKESQWTDSELVALIDEALTFVGTITNATRKADLDFFWQELAYATGRSLESLHEHSNIFIQNREYQKRTQELLYLVQQGSREALDTFIVREAQKLTHISGDISALSVLTVSQLIEEHSCMLEVAQDKKYRGLPQCSLPLLDQYLSGMRSSIVFVASDPLYKRALCMQNALDIIAHNPEACLVYVAFESSSYDVITSMRCYLANQEEQVCLEAAGIALKKLGDRMIILDSAVSSCITPEIILHQVSKLKAQTGTSRCVIVIDSLEEWPLAQDLACAVVTDKQQWRMDQVKILKRSHPNDPILVLSNASLLQDQHYISSDVVLTLTQATHEQLADAWLTHRGYSLSLNQEEHVKKVQSYVNKNKKVVCVLEIITSRGAAAPRTILVQFYPESLKFEQFNWN